MLTRSLPPGAPTSAASWHLSSCDKPTHSPSACPPPEPLTGASYQRSFMALELLALLLETFGDLLNPALVSAFYAYYQGLRWLLLETGTCPAPQW